MLFRHEGHDVSAHTADKRGKQQLFNGSGCMKHSLYRVHIGGRVKVLERRGGGGFDTMGVYFAQAFYSRTSPAAPGGR